MTQPEFDFVIGLAILIAGVLLVFNGFRMSIKLDKYRFENTSSGGVVQFSSYSKSKLHILLSRLAQVQKLVGLVLTVMAALIFFGLSTETEGGVKAESMAPPPPTFNPSTTFTPSEPRINQFDKLPIEKQREIQIRNWARGTIGLLSRKNDYKPELPYHLFEGMHSLEERQRLVGTCWKQINDRRIDNGRRHVAMPVVLTDTSIYATPAGYSGEDSPFQIHQPKTSLK